MPRVMGRDIPGKKRLFIALTYIFGVGRDRSAEIIKRLNLDPNRPADDLSSEEIAQINTMLTKEYSVEGELQRQIRNNIDRLKEIRCYRGLRHISKLPVRGQRTSTNARTRKGPKKQTIAGKRKAPAPK